jgi:tetratricopeptide (TPR) repeat protein
MRHLLILALVVTGASDQDWVGKRVITKHGTVLKVGKAVVDDAKRSTDLAISGHDRGVFRVYRVERVNWPWLWLKDERGVAEGWAKIENLVLYDQAIDYFTNEIRANPSSSVYISRGSIRCERGEYDIAIGDFNEAIRLDSRSEGAYCWRGIAWYAKKDYDKAIADYGEAIRLDPRFVLAYLNRGNAWSAKKVYEKALADYGEMIRLDPKDAWGYNGRAWLQATCPDAKYRSGKKAFEDASRACQIAGEKAAYPQGTLAAAYAECGDFDAAVKWQEKAQGLYTDEKAKKDGLARLELYRAKKPYRDNGS